MRKRPPAWEIFKEYWFELERIRKGDQKNQISPLPPTAKRASLQKGTRERAPLNGAVERQRMAAAVTLYRDRRDAWRTLSTLTRDVVRNVAGPCEAQLHTSLGASRRNARGLRKG